MAMFDRSLRLDSYRLETWNGERWQLIDRIAAKSRRQAVRQNKIDMGQSVWRLRLATSFDR